MKVKTVKAYQETSFDAKVNHLLSQGWHIHSFAGGGTSNSTCMIAYLVRDDD